MPLVDTLVDVLVVWWHWAGCGVPSLVVVLAEEVVFLVIDDLISLWLVCCWGNSFPCKLVDSVRRRRLSLTCWSPFSCVPAFSLPLPALISLTCAVDAISIWISLVEEACLPCYCHGRILEVGKCHLHQHLRCDAHTQQPFNHQIQQRMRTKLRLCNWSDDLSPLAASCSIAAVSSRLKLSLLYVILPKWFLMLLKFSRMWSTVDCVSVE